VSGGRQQLGFCAALPGKNNLFHSTCTVAVNGAAATSLRQTEDALVDPLSSVVIVQVGEIKSEALDI
jgi:hypothetical protein